MSIHLRAGNYLALLLLLMFGFGGNAQAQVGGGLDCNGLSPISHNVKSTMFCTDPHGANGERFEDNDQYIGHDEPSVQFFSTQHGSGNNMAWRFTLPKRDPIPTQSGSHVATFELTPTFWFSMALCDDFSYPLNPCKPDSDENTGIGFPSDAGSAVLEVQFYPPGWYPLISFDNTHWAAALTIDSAECNFGFATCNANCTEPVNFAFIQQNGTPAGPPAPGQQTAATFLGDAETLVMNPGDDIVLFLRDTRDGLRVTVMDMTTGSHGFMVASAKNGFAHTDFTSCATTPYNFHPEYDTAAPQNINPWGALELNINLAVETGHFELGINGDGDSDDSDCMVGPTISGCIDNASGGDLDFDGPPYLPDWPDGSEHHPSSFLLGSLNLTGVGPLSFVSEDEGYAGVYPSIQFITDVPSSDASCNVATGAGCIAPPHGAKFYPFFTQIGNGTSCRFAFGNDIRGKTTNDFGKDAEWGTPTPLYFGSLGSGPLSNPCTPQATHEDE